jgi:hypothetical protein
MSTTTKKGENNSKAHKRGAPRNQIQGRQHTHTSQQHGGGEGRDMQPNHLCHPPPTHTHALDPRAHSGSKLRSTFSNVATSRFRHS